MFTAADDDSMTTTADHIADFREEITHARERLAAAEQVIVSETDPRMLARAYARRDYSAATIERYTRIIARLEA